MDNTVSPSRTTTTLYIGGSVYQNDTLHFIGHEEGRIRFRASDNTFQFDYFEKDHLGNVRAVITEETQTDAYPAATMETATATTEETFYSNLNTRSTVPSGYPSNTPSGNARVAKVNGSGNKIGPAIVLKVMAGDQFHFTVNSWYKSDAFFLGYNTGIASELAAALNSGVGGITAGHGGATATDLQNGGVFSSGVTSFLASQPVDEDKPAAFVSWVLFDEQFRYVSTGSGSEVVGASEAYTTHTRSNMPVSKNGYLYIYTSNETSDQDVFFDNLQVTHVRGRLLEETHYYPFGLTMKGISGKAVTFGNPKNKKGYAGNEIQNGEFSDGSGQELYDFNARIFNQQIGRFAQIDPESEEGGQEALSTYHYCYNNPVTFSDPDGRLPIILPFVIWALAGGAAAAPAVTIGVGVTTTLVIAEANQQSGSFGFYAPPVPGGMGVPSSKWASMGNKADSKQQQPKDIVLTPKEKAELERPLVMPKDVTRAKGVIYEVPGKATKSGKPYVGRTKHSTPAQRRSDGGRDRKKAKVVDTYNSNDPQDGRVKEQKKIDEKGLNNLDNKRNEIKPPKKD